MRFIFATFAIAVVAFNACAAEVPGAALYQKRCASCHGAAGQGGKKFEKPLTGDRSVPQLSKQIRETMPEDAPNSLSVADADAIATYVHDAFYSLAAREKNHPPRIELARLTIPQYRQSVADLIETFRYRGQWDDKHGLKAEYFSGRRMGNDKRVLERVDALVNFDFGDKAPPDVKTEPHEFAMRWSGGLLAPETGEYEIVVHTDQAFRLFLNDNTRPLLDYWVKSGTDTEYKATLPLVGGRIYPLRMEWTKGKQGVDDSKTNKPKAKPAFVRLEWKPPHKSREPIPSRHLTPNNFAEVYVSATPFPPDDRSYGWERGTTVSKAWDAATTDAALDAAGYVASRINQLANTQDNAKDGDEKVRAFCAKFVQRAFRQPLTPDQKSLYIERPFTGTTDLTLAVKKCVLLTLKSPRFLYRELDGGTLDYEVAARLSFALWDSIPDEELLRLAAANQLHDRAAVAKQAERMLADPRAKAKLLGFFTHWLALDHAAEVAKDTKRFPGFDAAVISDLRTSLELFVDGVLWSDKADYRELFTTDTLPLNARLARLYGLELPANADFQPMKLDADKRAGVLTHPYLLAVFSYNAETSPIHRGVFVSRGLLGVALKPPPQAVTPSPPDLHPSLNTRERVGLQTKAATCMTCHSVINPLGFTLERFDAIGRYRETDNKKPVDSAGSYQARDGKTVSFTGAKELGRFLAESPEAHASFAEQMFHHLAQQSLRAYGPKTGEELRAAFADNNFNMRKLAIEVAVRAALMPRQK